MTYLYKSASGREVEHASSSSLDSFKFCRRKFKLERIDGWKSRSRKASLEFGKAIEAAIQFYYSNGQKPGDGTDEFKRIWLKFADTDLTYTEQEGSHSDLYKMGSEMMRQFEIIAPTLPIRNPKWQLEYAKALWPGSEYGNLGFKGFVDCLSTLEDGTRIIIDIKTAKSLLDVTPNMLAMDGQLRKYAWVSGICKVGFLNFVKARPDSFKKGDEVFVLDPSINRTTATVYEYDSEKKELIAGSAGYIAALDLAKTAIKGKGATEAKENLVRHYIDNGLLRVLPRDSVTKTRIQYLQAEVSEEDLKEVGQGVGVDVLTMVQAARDGFYPADGGARFPNNRCTWCEYRGICLQDSKLRDQMLVQITPKQESDFLAELEAETE